MTDRSQTELRSPTVAVMLSLLLCGLGQIYLRRIARGLILFLTFCLAIVIIWLALYGTEFKLIDWGNNELMFNPSRSITIREYTFYVSDIMKVTGAIQLAFAWIFSIADAGRGRAP